MDYTDYLEVLNQCNYINPDISNSEDFILSCINQPNKKNPAPDDYCINMSIQMQDDNVEGFSNDHSSIGPGVSYSPLGICHDGQTRDEEGRCVYQEYRGRKRDGGWQRGNHNETMHEDKQLYKICSNGTFLGLLNGHPICEINEDNEENIIEGFTPVRIEKDEEQVYTSLS